MATALEPELTQADVRVLTVLPELGGGWPNRQHPRPAERCVSLWQVAEALRSEDLADVRQTLNGLVQLDYVECANSTSRRMRVWWRSQKGDEAVDGSPSWFRDRPRET